MIVLSICTAIAVNGEVTEIIFRALSSFLGSEIEYLGMTLFSG